MADTKFYVASGQFPGDASDINVTVPQEITANRLPTGAILYATRSSQQGNLGLKFGLTVGCAEFTSGNPQRCMYVGAEDDESPTSTRRKYSGSNGNELNLGYLHATQGGATNRSAVMTPVIGGVQISMQEVGTAYTFYIRLIFGSAVKLINDGLFESTDVPYTVNTGFATKAKLAFFYFNGDDFTSSTGSNNADLSHGIMIDGIDQAGSFEQFCFHHRVRQNQPSGFCAGAVRTDRIGALSNNSGGAFHYVEMTSNDVGSIELVARDGNQQGQIIGLIVECDDVDVKGGLLTSPVSPVTDWDVVIGMQPQWVHFIMSGTAPAQLDIGHSGGPSIGHVGACDFDENGVICSAHSTDEAGSNPTNCRSTVDNVQLDFRDDDASIGIQIAAISPTIDGWHADAADVLATTGVEQQWLYLAVETSTSAAVPVLSNPLDTFESWDKSIASVVSTEGSGTIYAVVTQSAITPSHLQIVAGQDDLGAPADAQDSVNAVNATNNLSFSGLDENIDYFTHFTQETAVSAQVDAIPVSADGFTTPANRSPVLDTPIDDQTCVIGLPFGPLDVSGNFSDPDGDTLIFTQTGLPNGLVISTGGVISGTPTGGYQP